jgi:hypothetical protein
MGEKERIQRRWTLLNYFRPLTKVNIFNENLHNTFQHEVRKFRIYWTLRQQGYDIIVEGEFLNLSRCDLFCIDTKTIIEVLYSETEEECREKFKKYPQEFNLVINNSKELFNPKDVL